MELKFLGRGSAHNYKEGNTAAYFVENNELFLIDCGEDVFQKIMGKDLLENKSKIHILITHTHSDHVGSLGSLLSYTYYKLKQKVNIIVSGNEQQKKEIKRVLECFAIKEDAYSFVDAKDYENKYTSFMSINYIKTEHTPTLSCFSIIFDTSNGIIFYSGDTCEVCMLEVLFKKKEKIEKLYLDLCSDKENVVHMFIDDVKSVIPGYLTSKVYAMHINDEKCKKLAMSYGFNIVDID